MTIGDKDANMSRAAVKPPTGWGKDPLTSYFDEFRGNQYGTFANKQAAVGDLIRIDGLFKRFLDGAINPRPLLPMGFLLRAHSAYRAGANAVMAGQLYEAQAMLRLCIEHGAYGFYIGADDERWKRWMTRNDSPAAKQAVRDEFSHGKIKKHIQAVSAKMGSQFETLYEMLIDFGAHPNEQGFSMSSAIRRVDGNVHFDTIYLHGDGVPLDLALKSLGQVGLWVLHIAQLIYVAKFRLLGIEIELEEIRRRY
jgi:hypothetical protein